MIYVNPVCVKINEEYGKVNRKVKWIVDAFEMKSSRRGNLGPSTGISSAFRTTRPLELSKK